MQLGAQEPIYETLLQSAIWNEKNHLFSGAYGMVWTPADRLISPTDLYMKKQSKQSPADSQGIIELMHGHMVKLRRGPRWTPSPTGAVTGPGGRQEGRPQ